MSTVLDPLPDRVKGCCNELARPLADRTAADLARLYKALADPTRVQMLHMLKSAILRKNVEMHEDESHADEEAGETT